MSTEPSKFAENQFLSATEGSFPLMDDLLADSYPKLSSAVGVKPILQPALLEMTEAKGLWDAGMLLILNKEALQLSCTAAVADYMAGLTRKPSVDVNSTIEAWESTIRVTVPFQGTQYKYLLPYGRETLTVGDNKAKIDAGLALATRLAENGEGSPLAALGGVVQAWYSQAQSLLLAQKAAMNGVTTLRGNQETLRVRAAEALYMMVGLGMAAWKGQPAMVDTLFDVNLMRSTPQAVPAVPGQPAWDAIVRRLSLPALPAGATRLDAWRLGPGGAPEKLATGAFNEPFVQIPASVTWDAGDLYQLWFTARNARGISDPGPSVSWTA